MSWKCYSCGTVNPNSADTCKNCNGNVAAPKDFYVHWVFGGAAFFFVTYLAGILLGGTLVEVAAAPQDAQIMAKAKEAGSTAPSILTLDPDLKKEAKKKAIEENKAGLSSLLKGTLLWILPFIFFVICGAIVGFVSDGKTIIEAGIGSVIGQIAGFFLATKVLNADIGYIALAVGVIIGIGLAIAGAWLGEIIQDRRERAV